MTQPTPPIRVAVTQAEPVWLDLEATVEKTCELIREAASNDAQLIAFPECWIPGYPAWIWIRPVDTAMTCEYIRNSLKLDSSQMLRIQRCAADHKMVVVLGFSENVHDSLYISQVTINASGDIVMARSKIKATHMERTVFGDSPASCLNSVAQTDVARVGALSCWEHIQPLLKYHTYSGREQIHVGAWPPLFEHGGEGDDSLWSMSSAGTRALASTYAIESQSFVLHCTAVLSQSGIDKMKTQGGAMMATPGGGRSAIFGPDGRKLSTDLPETQEGIIYADLDLELILKAKSFVDVCGHYSRPDLLWLSVDKEIKEHVREREGDGRNPRNHARANKHGHEITNQL